MFRLPKQASMMPLIVLVVLCSGCVRRTIMITSEPAGVLVWVNDREVGRTPVDIDFEFYGVYDVRLELAGYEPMMTFGEAAPPWWDGVGADFFAELVPADLHSEVHWHYDLAPLMDDREALVDRADQLRQDLSDPQATDSQADSAADGD